MFQQFKSSWSLVHFFLEAFVDKFFPALANLNIFFKFVISQSDSIGDADNADSIGFRRKVRRSVVEHHISENSK